MKKFLSLFLILLFLAPTAVILSACGNGKNQPTNQHVHTFGNWITQAAATCNEAPTQIRVCSSCSYVETRISGTALGHSFGEPEILLYATCENGAVEIRYCTRAGCDATDTQQGVPLGHSWNDWEPQTEANCVSPRIDIKRCTRNNCTVTETRTHGAALGHVWSSWSTQSEATCTTPLVQSRTCETCTLVETRNHGDALGHTWGDWTNTAATCEERAKSERTCGTCNATEIEYSGELEEHGDAIFGIGAKTGKLVCENCEYIFGNITVPVSFIPLLNPSEEIATGVSVLVAQSVVRINIYSNFIVASPVIIGQVKVGSPIGGADALFDLKLKLDNSVWTTFDDPNHTFTFTDKKGTQFVYTLFVYVVVI